MVARAPVIATRNSRRFKNLEPVTHARLGDLIKWGLTRSPGPWRAVTAPPGPPPQPRVSDMRVTLVGHSTVLVQCAGLNILTDPVWSERVSPVRLAGPRRRRPPGLRLGDLPPIDIVLVSHDHYDHLDVPTLRRLAAHRPRVFTGLGNGRTIGACGLSAREMAWWGEAEHGGAHITFVPAQHFSGRGLSDRDRTLWGGFFVRTDAGSFYFAGDTGWGQFFDDVRRRLGPPRLALLPIGGYKPRWFMSGVHISPAEAVRAHEVLGARTSVAIHYGTFALADEGMDEPEADLEAALEAHRDARFWVVPHGEGRDVPAAAGKARRPASAPDRSR